MGKLPRRQLKASPNRKASQAGIVLCTTSQKEWTLFLAQAILVVPRANFRPIFLYNFLGVKPQVVGRLYIALNQ